jgi:hypothetical protein
MDAVDAEGLSAANVLAAEAEMTVAKSRSEELGGKRDISTGTRWTKREELELSIANLRAEFKAVDTDLRWAEKKAHQSMSFIVGCNSDCNSVFESSALKTLQLPS